MKYRQNDNIKSSSGFAVSFILGKNVMKFGISVYTKSPDTRSLGAPQAPTSSLWPFGRSGRVMMIASYTYVCTMHVKNGDKQTNRWKAEF